MEASEGKCWEKCPEGTVGTVGGQCVKCYGNCKTCFEQADQCATCLNGYYLLRNSVCVRLCPRGYLADDSLMQCVFQGEIAFPLPFSIVVAVATLGLCIARFMKNQTRMFIALIALTDLVLKFNWVFLLIYLLIGQFYVSATIIAYCLFMTLVTNGLMWKFTLERSGLLQDPGYVDHTLKYRMTSTILLYLSYTVSFHVFRMSYSRLFGRKAFSVCFNNQKALFTILGRMSVWSIFALYLPAVAANSYNLYYCSNQQQVFYFDIDGLILVTYQCLLVGVVIKQREKAAGMFDIKEMVQDIIKTGLKTESID